MTEDDVAHAVAALADSRDQYVPTFSANGGVGRSYGISLNIPTILTLNTQSIVYTASQRDYLRSAHAALQAATLALTDMRAQVQEDAANTYLSLESAQQRHTAIDDEHAITMKLVEIVQDRLSAGIESDLDLKKARRTELQIRLQELSLEDDIGSLREHLAQLVGLPSAGIEIEPESIPPNSYFAVAGGSLTSAGDGPSLQSLEANAKAKHQQALGDEHFSARPQFLFQAQYGRISPINDVSTYYNLQGHYNTFAAGVLIVLPLLDKSHSARARETMADASHTLHEVDNLRSQQIENRLGLQHSVEELSVKASLAEVDLGIAQDDLATTVAEVNSNNADVAGRPMTAQDEQNARLAERGKFVDLLTTTDQLRKAQITLLRQSGSFDNWIASLPKP
jgi:outer membrane protein TolC